MKKARILFISSIVLLLACTDDKLDNPLDNSVDDIDNGNKTEEILTLSYTDSPSQSFFLIKADDEMVDGKVVQVDWSNQDQGTKSTSVSNGLSNTLELSKIINDKRRFPAVQFALDLNEKEGKSVDEDNITWYLPSKNELLLMHIYSGSLNLTQYSYWSSTEWVNASNYRNNAWVIVPNTNMTGLSTMTKIDGFHYKDEPKGASVRLVKKNDVEGKKYPYVKSKSEAIIVSRDKDGGVKESALRKEFPLTATTDLEENGVSRCFEVDLTNIVWASLEEAKAICASRGDNWRVPTLREMQLIWAMGGSNQEWGAYALGDGINLRDVQGFNSLSSAEFAISNPGFFFWEENSYMSEYRFLASLCTILGGNPQGTRQAIRLVRDVEID